MNRYRFAALLLLFTLLLGACNPDQTRPSPGGEAATPAGMPQVSVTHAPDAENALNTYLEYWQQDAYEAMYALLTEDARAAIDAETFADRYREAANALSLQNLAWEVRSVLTTPDRAEVAFHLSYQTVLVGTLERDLVARFQMEDGRWRLIWDEGLILPELSGGNRLVTRYNIPARGSIYDRNGKPLASYTNAYALGLIPGQIDPEQEEGLLVRLARLTGLTTEEIYASYQYAQPDWYIPLAEFPAEAIDPIYDALVQYKGLVIAPYESRYYYGNGIASQSVGYLLSIPPEEYDAYRRRGYSGEERVGAAGVERWGEAYLIGAHGASLYVVNPQGEIVTRLAGRDPSPAADVYLTIDRDFQARVDAALGDFTGAIVVLERDSGRVLALASSPNFDPNLFDPKNRNFIALGDMLSDPRNPLYNRATQGEYPLGSVFKVITMAAALESGFYTPDTIYDCQYTFEELPDRVLYDWTWERYQKEKEESEDGEGKTQPSGILTLQEGLMRSCNPYFWHIGLDLYRRNMTTAISDMALNFGLGAPTGIEIEESSGNITPPTDIIMAVNEAIGQDPVLVTPLQVARFMAALGNGGTLYRPQLIDHVQPVVGEPLEVFAPEPQGQLDIRPETLEAIQQAMRMVVANPRGTAYHRLGSLRIPVAGKTGTAQTGGDPHAWFAGYTYAEIEGVPDIAVAVIVENIGEGSQYAAPIFRRVVEEYFYNRAQSLYPWESGIGVVPTPQP